MLKRKPLRRKKKVITDEEIIAQNNMWNFFLEVWMERAHRCGSCGKSLGNDPKSFMFDHLLEKSKYPQLKYEKTNILLVCGDCHASKSLGHPTDTHNNAINAAKAIFLNNES